MHTVSELDIANQLRQDDQRTYVERSHEARDHCWHAIHDLEANQFFVSLVSRSRGAKR